MAAAVELFACETEPLSPWLSTGTETFVFSGLICVDVADASASWLFPASCATVCVDGPAGGGDESAAAVPAPAPAARTPAINAMSVRFIPLLRISGWLAPVSRPARPFRTEGGQPGGSVRVPSSPRNRVTG